MTPQKVPTQTARECPYCGVSETLLPVDRYLDMCGACVRTLARNGRMPKLYRCTHCKYQTVDWGRMEAHILGVGDN